MLGVPLAAALGVLIFLGSFVPLIGLTVAGALCTAVAVLEHGLTAGIVVAVAIIVLVQLEAHLLQPLIMSRSVEVHPLAIALSVLTGTTLAGIVGALLAVPFVAFLNSTIHAMRDSPALPVGDTRFPVRHKESPFGDPVDGTEPVDDDTEGDTDTDAARCRHACRHGCRRAGRRQRTCDATNGGLTTRTADAPPAHVEVQLRAVGDLATGGDQARGRCRACASARTCRW